MGTGDEYYRENSYRRDRVLPNMHQEYQPNVGFEPGQIGTRPPLLTKLDFQYKLYEAWYMEEDYNFFLRHPLSFMLTFWWPCTLIVSLTFVTLASTFIPAYFELTGIFGIVPTLFTLGFLYYWFTVFVFKVSMVCLIRHRRLGHVFADQLAWTDGWAARWAPPAKWNKV